MEHVQLGLLSEPQKASQILGPKKQYLSNVHFLRNIPCLREKKNSIDFAVKCLCATEWRLAENQFDEEDGSCSRCLSENRFTGRERSTDVSSCNEYMVKRQVRKKRKHRLKLDL